MKSILVAASPVFFFLVIASKSVMSDVDVAPNSPLTDNTLAQSEAPSTLPLFDENSITRDYINSFNGIEWEHKLGDWVDRNGTPQGAVPWATADVNPGTQGPIRLDVTVLASAQRGKKDQLMVLSATQPVDVWSGQGNQSPKLKVTLMDDSSLELSPELDCYVALSDYRNNNSDTLKFDPSLFKAFIQFKIPNKEFKTAVLELWPKKIWGTGRIQVFNLAPQDTMFQSSDGIAQGYSSYSELEGHPDVIFIDSFDEPKLKPEWTVQAQGSSQRINDGYFSGEIDNSHHSIVNIRYYFAKNQGEEPTENYFRYSVRFHKDFVHATQGGKLPGQAGTYNRCGWGKRKPSATCPGWAARMDWRPPIKVGPYKDMIPVGTFLSHLGQETIYEDELMWQAFCRLGEWCELEQYVKLNSPDKADGILRGYHGGKLVLERQNIRFRDRESVKIEDAWTLIYHGGMGFPTKPIHADLDNVVIARKYIGSLGSARDSRGNDGPALSVNQNAATAEYPRNPESLTDLSSSVDIQQGKRSKPTLKNKPSVGQPNPRLANLADNTAIDLGKFSCTVPKGDTYPCTRVTDYSGMVYDQNHHQILMFGGGHSTTFTDSVFIFDFDSLTWKEDYPPTPCTTDYMIPANYDPMISAWKQGSAGPYPRPISTHSYDLLAVTTAPPELVLLKGSNGESRSCPPDPPKAYYFSHHGKIAHYQLQSRTWEFSNNATGAEAGRFASAEYDPVSGTIILLGRRGLFAYDPAKRNITRIKNQVPDLGFANELVYYPPNDRMYYFDRVKKNVWELELDRNNLMKSTLHKLDVKGDYPDRGEPGYAYDKVNGIIGGAVHHNEFYIFDPRTKTWSSQVIAGGKPGSMDFHAIVYNPVDNVFVFLAKAKTWMYRYRS